VVAKRVEEGYARLESQPVLLPVNAQRDGNRVRSNDVACGGLRDSGKDRSAAEDAGRGYRCPRATQYLDELAAAKLLLSLRVVLAGPLGTLGNGSTSGPTNSEPAARTAY
jgi:hypothetical protein